MMEAVVRRLAWASEKVMDVLGWHGVVAVLLVVGGAVFHAVVIARQPAELAAMKAASHALEAQLGERRARPVAADANDLLLRFHRDLPHASAAQYNATLLSIQRAAKAEVITLDQAGYSVTPVVGAPLEDLEISLPVAGGYGQLRRFIARSLSENPALALQALNFDRQSVNNARVDAQLRFTLYLQKP